MHRGEHVKRAERNNQTIAGDIRAIFHSLPYKAYPRTMTKYATMVAAANFNHFPAKGGVSSYYSPHVIMGKKPLNYKKHCLYNFGDYVEGFHENYPTNTQKQRAVSGIYLRPLPNSLNSHEIMNLETGLVNKVVKVTKMQITDHVIKAVNALAEEQGIKSLKIESKNKVPIMPADWIAGVDTEEAQEENEANEVDEDDPQDRDYQEPQNTRYEYERDINNEGKFEAIDDDELAELLADEHAVDYRARDADELVSEVVDEEPVAEEQPNEESNPINSTQNDEITGVAEQIVEAEQDDESDPDDEIEVVGVLEGENRPTRTQQQPERMTYDRFGSPTKTARNYFQKPTIEMLERKHNIFTQTTTSLNPELDLEYTPHEAAVLGMYINHLNTVDMKTGYSFGQQYMFEKGLKVFGDRAWNGGMKELTQLNDREVFAPTLVNDLTPEEKEKAQEALLFVTEKRDLTVKGRLCYNGKPLRAWTDKEDTASPTVSQEGVTLTSAIAAKEGRDKMSGDVPNAFVQANMPAAQLQVGDRVIMKVTGSLAKVLVQLDPNKYEKFMVFENGRPVIYLIVLKAIYGLLVAALIWYQKFRTDLEGIGFVFNNCDPCVCNRTVYGKQHTVCFHVDDLFSTHMEPRVNDEFEAWLNKMYGEYSEVKTTRGDIHDFLGVIYDFSEPGKVKLDMIDYVQQMLDEFPVKFTEKDSVANPAATDLFEVGNGKLLDAKTKKEFHTFTAKGLFLCGRARPDIKQVIAVLCTRVQNANVDFTQHPCHHRYQLPALLQILALNTVAHNSSKLSLATLFFNL